MIELYKLVQDGTTYAYTSANEDVTYDGDVYTPVTIGRGDIEQADDMNRESLSVTVPRDNPLGLSLISTMQDTIVSFTLFLQDAGETNAIWKGRVLTAQATDSEITMDCEAVFTSLKRAGLRGRYQKRCRHALYGTQCGVNKATHAVAGTVTAVNGHVLTVTGLTGTTYYAGMVTYDGVTRFIINQSGTSLTLSHPIDDLTTAVITDGSAAVTLYPGCRLTHSDCNSKFSNTINYGGFPWIPDINPFGFTSIV